MMPHADLTCQETHKFIQEQLKELGIEGPGDSAPTEAQLGILRKKLGDGFQMPASKAEASAQISALLSTPAGGAKEFKPASEAQLKFIRSLLMTDKKPAGQVRSVWVPYLIVPYLP